MSSSLQTDLIQVPTDLPKALTTTVDSLRTEISQLWKYNASLEAELRCLQENSGAAFCRFPQLPPEIRLLIWEFALTAPQVHIISEDLVSFSKVNYVMQACKEARGRGQKLLLPYYLMSTTPTYELQEWKEESVKHYINVNVDTIWFDAVDKPDGSSTAFVSVPRFLEFFCGRCNPRSSIFQIWSPSPSECQHDLRLRRLAIHNSCWKDPDQNNPLFAGSAWVLQNFNGVREPFIIVGDSAPAKALQDFEFTIPTLPPYELLPTLSDYMDSNLPPEVSVWSKEAWSFMACRLQNILEEFKVKHIEFIRSRLQRMYLRIVWVSGGVD